MVQGSILRNWEGDDTLPVTGVTVPIRSLVGPLGRFKQVPASVERMFPIRWRAVF